MVYVSFVCVGLWVLVLFVWVCFQCLLCFFCVRRRGSQWAARAAVWQGERGGEKTLFLSLSLSPLDPHRPVCHRGREGRGGECPGAAGSGGRTGVRREGGGREGGMPAGIEVRLVMKRHAQNHSCLLLLCSTPHSRAPPSPGSSPSPEAPCCPPPRPPHAPPTPAHAQLKPQVEASQKKNVGASGMAPRGLRLTPSTSSSPSSSSPSSASCPASATFSSTSSASSSFSSSSPRVSLFLVLHAQYYSKYYYNESDREVLEKH